MAERYFQDETHHRLSICIMYVRTCFGVTERIDDRPVDVCLAPIMSVSYDADVSFYLLRYVRVGE